MTKQTLNPTMQDIEWTIRRLCDAGIFGDKEQAALAATAHLIAELRVNLHYNPRMTDVFNVTDKLRNRSAA